MTRSQLLDSCKAGKCLRAVRGGVESRHLHDCLGLQTQDHSVRLGLEQSRNCEEQPNLGAVLRVLIAIFKPGTHTLALVKAYHPQLKCSKAAAVAKS